MKTIIWLVIINFPLIATLTGQDIKHVFNLSETNSNKLLEAEGDTVKVKGFVESTNKNTTGIQFLQFKDIDFQCVTFARYVRLFEKPPIDLYKEKWIEVTGEIENYRGKPQIKLTSPDQITILKQPAPVAKKTVNTEPPPAEKKPEKVATPIQQVVKKKPAPKEPVLEEIDGVPAIDWRKYFPPDKTN